MSAPFRKKELDLDEVFEFKIGETIAHRGAVAGVDRPWERCERYTVIERHLNECHGGQQRSYLARAVAPQGTFYGQGIGIGNSAILLQEPEVCAFPVKPTEEVEEASIDARLDALETQLRRARRSAKEHAAIVHDKGEEPEEPKAP